LNDDVGSNPTIAQSLGVHEFLHTLNTHRLAFTFASDFEQAGIEYAVTHLVYTNPRWACVPRWLLPGVAQSIVERHWKQLDPGQKTSLCKLLTGATMNCDDSTEVKQIQLLFAIEIEEYANVKCSDTFTPPTMFRSYAAAVWTSCVSMSLHLCNRDGRVHPAMADIHLQLVRCQHTERVACSQIEGSFLTNDESPFAHPLQLLFQRSAQHAMRGWRRSLQALITTNPGIAALTIDSLLTSFSGLHPCVSPSLRPNWQARLYVQLVGVAELSQDKHSTLFRMHAICKESLRRTVAATVNSNVACGVAAKRLNNTMKNFEMPPMGTPHPSLVRHMVVLSKMGSKAYANSLSLEQAMDSMHGSNEQTTRSHDDRNNGCVMLSCGSDANTGIAFCQRIVSACFQSNFVPFWMWASLRDAKPQRLDRTQYDTFHCSLNRAQNLLDCLDERMVSEIEELVMRTPEAGVLDIRSTCELLNIANGVHLPKFVGGRNNTQRQIEYDYSIVRLLAPEELARLLCFGRFASINERVPVVQLNPTLREMQIDALLRRHCIKDREELMTKLTHLFTISYCSTCNRISNCLAPTYYDYENSSVPFQRSGVHRTSVVPRVYPPRLFCSNRNSAAFKIARLAQVESERLCIESQMHSTEEEHVNCQESLVKMAHDGTLASRMRRDSKRVMHQTREVEACGSCPMLSINILGRCVRLKGKWHSLCCYCGNYMEIHCYNRYDGALCCMHCPTSVTHDCQKPPSKPTYTCRLCKRTVKHPKSFHSPQDEYGENRHAPIETRVTHWCTTHAKPWMEDALKVLSPCIVMAHLTLGTRPSLSALEHKV
jgi:hypothetical protein